MGSADRIPWREQVRVRFGLELRAVVVLGLLGAVGVALALGIVWRGRANEVAAARVPTSASSTSTATTSPQSLSASPLSSPTALDVVVVDVVGAVARPGVIRLPVGSRVVDAIAATGGVLPGADTAGLNLARLLTDGEQIAVGIPATTDVPPGATSLRGTDPQTPTGPLDLNSATTAELEELPGVGPVLAGRIVEWRERNGRFASVEELNEVSGIGEATFAELAPLVRV